MTGLGSNIKIAIHMILSGSWSLLEKIIRIVIVIYNKLDALVFAQNFKINFRYLSYVGNDIISILLHYIKVIQCLFFIAVIILLQYCI